MNLNNMANINSRRLKSRLLLIQMMLPVANAFYVPYLTLYYASRGISDGQIGILAAIPYTVAFLVQPIWGRCSDRVRRKRSVLVVAAVGAGASILLYLLGSSFVHYFICSALLAVFHSSLVPLTDSMTITLADEDGLDYGRFRWIGSASYGILVLAFSGVLYKNAAASFPLASMGYLMFMCSLLACPTPQSARHGHIRPASSMVMTPVMYTMLVLMLFISIGTAFANGFYGVLCARIGLDQRMVGVTTFVGVMVQIPVSLYAHKVCNRVAKPVLLILCLLLTALRLLCMLSHSPVMLMLSQFMAGIIFMLSHYCIVVFMAEMADGQHRSTAQSLHTAQSAFGSITGTLLGGWVSQRFGMQNAFLWFAVALLAVSTAVLLAGLVKKEEKKKTINLFAEQKKP